MDDHVGRLALVTAALAADDDVSVKQPQPPLRKPSYSDLHSGKVEILSVDDHPVNQMVIENIIASMEGFTVRCSS